MKRIPLALVMGALAIPTTLASDTSAELGVAVREALEIQAAAEMPTYETAFADLNDDGVPNAIVLMTSRDNCGSGGCTMIIFRGTENGFARVSTSTITNPPIRVLPDKSHGWHTLIVHVRGGGLRPSEVVMAYGEQGYPSNPSMQPSATPQQVAQAHVVLETVQE